MLLFVRLSRAIFSLAAIALGVETLVYAWNGGNWLGGGDPVTPIIPWPPAIPVLVYACGAIWVICGVGMLYKRAAALTGLILSGMLLLSAIVFDIPRNAVDLGNISLRTAVFEPLALASLACMLTRSSATPAFLARASRYLFAICLIVFGVDHFAALAFIATLLPAWIPWHKFWVVFFGAGFIAAGIGIAANHLPRLSAALLGLMFGVWVVTLHLPRILGFYHIPGASRNPAEWQSLFIAIAMCGGAWALTKKQ